MRQAIATKVPYTVTNRAASVLFMNRMRTVPSDSPNFSPLVAALRCPTHDLDLIGDLVDISRFVARMTFGAVQIADDQVRWNGDRVHHVIADRLVDMLRAGHDLEPLANFLSNLLQNPTESARTELYDWMQSSDSPMPITPDGHFLAFKKVNDNYRDFFQGTFDNSVGAVCEEDRSLVDPNRHNECSRGLHFCSYNYLSEYYGGQGRVMIVQINPADVVAIPVDYNRQKGRTWRYLVVGEVPADEAAQFFRETPVVQPYVERVSVSSDVDNVPTFEDGDVVLFIGDDNDADEYVLTVGGEYTLLGATDSDGEVEVTNDEGYFRYVPARLFKLMDTTDINDDGGTGEELDEGEEVEAELPVQANGEAPLMFTHGARTFLAAEVLSLAKDHGQRGFQRFTGVPRTTLQGWLKAIEEQGE